MRIVAMSMQKEKKNKKEWRHRGIARRLSDEQGASLLELAFLLPILVVLAFGVIDLGRLIHARLVVTNVCREGGSLASRDIRNPGEIVTILQSSATPFDLANQGKIYVIKIKAGTSLSKPNPYVSVKYPSPGGYSVSSSIPVNAPNDLPRGGGLSNALYDHLQYEAGQNTSDIAEISVVEVFYLYQPITPLPKFVQNLVLPTGGILIGSKAVF
jgi:hypothetical protein